MSEQCILAVCPAEPNAGDDPQQLAAHWREVIRAHNGTADGRGRLIPVEKGWEGSSVAVWAVVDLGFQKLFSPPLILGQSNPFALEVAAAASRRSEWRTRSLRSQRPDPGCIRGQ